MVLIWMTYWQKYKTSFIISTQWRVYEEKDLEISVTQMSPWWSPILEYGSKTDSHFFLKYSGNSTTLLSLGACSLLIYLSTASSTSQPVSLSPVGCKEGEVYVGFSNRQCKQTKP